MSALFLAFALHQFTYNIDLDLKECRSRYFTVTQSYFQKRIRPPEVFVNVIILIYLERGHSQSLTHNIQSFIMNYKNSFSQLVLKTKSRWLELNVYKTIFTITTIIITFYYYLLQSQEFSIKIKFIKCSLEYSILQ